MAAHEGVIEQSSGRHAHTGRLLPAHFFSNAYRSVSSSPGLPFLLTPGTIQEGAEQVAQDMQPLSLTLFGTFGTIVVVGTLVWVGTALFSLPFSPPAAASEEKRELLGTPQTPAGRLCPLHPRKRVRERGICNTWRPWTSCHIKDKKQGGDRSLRGS